MNIDLIKSGNLKNLGKANEVISQVVKGTSPVIKKEALRTDFHKAAALQKGMEVLGKKYREARKGIKTLLGLAKKSKFRGESARYYRKLAQEKGATANLYKKGLLGSILGALGLSTGTYYYGKHVGRRRR